MTEHDLFKEVQEDLDRQKLEAMWKKYGPWIIIAALCVVLATAAGTSYRSWKASRDMKTTAGFMEASSASISNKLESLQKFAGENKESAMADLALLRAGATAVDQNENDKAIKIFDQLAANEKSDLAFRQLGDLLSVQLQMDAGDAALLSSRLQPLTAENAPWRYSAMEAQAYLALRAGDKGKAKSLFTDLSQDARVPQSIAFRATSILRSLD